MQYDVHLPMPIRLSTETLSQTHSTTYLDVFIIQLISLLAVFFGDSILRIFQFRNFDITQRILVVVCRVSSWGARERAG